MPLRRRTGFNPKRKLAVPPPTTEERQRLVAAVRYGGNPEHKRNPGDYGLTPPSQPRAGKTLCDAEGQFLKAGAEDLLRQGITKGMVSERRSGNFPQNVWSVDEQGGVFEAQLENQEQGVYHGYPMPGDDDFRELILKEWNARP